MSFLTALLYAATAVRIAEIMHVKEDGTLSAQSSKGKGTWRTLSVNTVLYSPLDSAKEDVAVLFDYTETIPCVDGAPVEKRCLKKIADFLDTSVDDIQQRQQNPEGHLVGTDVTVSGDVTLEEYCEVFITPDNKICILTADGYLGSSDCSRNIPEEEELLVNMGDAYVVKTDDGVVNFRQGRDYARRVRDGIMLEMQADSDDVSSVMATFLPFGFQFDCKLPRAFDNKCEKACDKNILPACENDATQDQCEELLFRDVLKQKRTHWKKVTGAFDRKQWRLDMVEVLGILKRLYAEDVTYKAHAKAVTEARKWLKAANEFVREPEFDTKSASTLSTEFLKLAGNTALTKRGEKVTGGELYNRKLNRDGYDFKVVADMLKLLK